MIRQLSRRTDDRYQPRTTFTPQLRPAATTTPRTHSRTTPPRGLFRPPLAVVLVALALTLCAADVAAQNVSAPPASPQASPASPAAPRESRVTADEDFELNISERRITEGSYEASTAVEVGDAAAHGLNLRVGVALGASGLDVLLRNVRGRVRFRASLAPVLERLAPRAASPTPPPPAPPSQPAPPSP